MVEEADESISEVILPVNHADVPIWQREGRDVLPSGSMKFREDSTGHNASLTLVVATASSASALSLSLTASDAAKPPRCCGRFWREDETACGTAI